MPQSLANVVIHVTFSTKNRNPRLTPEIWERLIPYLLSVLRNHGCDSIQTGGVEDHIHILLRLSRTVSIAEVLEKVKTTTTKWIQAEWPTHRDFAWQRGYGAFSVSPRDVAGLVHYVKNQAEHHRKVSFQDEYRDLMKDAGINIDERYVWD